MFVKQLEMWFNNLDWHKIVTPTQELLSIHGFSMVYETEDTPLFAMYGRSSFFSKVNEEAKKKRNSVCASDTQKELKQGVHITSSLQERTRGSGPKPI